MNIYLALAQLVERGTVVVFISYPNVTGSNPVRKTNMRDVMVTFKPSKLGLGVRFPAHVKK